mgnify:FL=1
MNPADYQYTYGVPMPIEPNMLETVVSLIERLGVSIAVVFASFYYILFLTKQAKEERQAFWKKDAENDEKLLKIVESSSDALIHVKNALDQNTQAMRELLYRK